MLELESQKAEAAVADSKEEFLKGRSHSVITVFDGEEPGMVGLYVEHNRVEGSTGTPGLHYICTIAIARLWDSGVVQALTGPLCPDLIKKDGVDGEKEPG